MIGTMLAMSFVAAAQGDSMRASREAFQLCLRQHMNRSIEARTAVTEFETSLAQQCAEQAAAYRTAVVQREISFRSSRANAERSAEEQISEARSNFLERYRIATEPQ